MRKFILARKFKFFNFKKHFLARKFRFLKSLKTLNFRAKSNTKLRFWRENSNIYKQKKYILIQISKAKQEMKKAFLARKFKEIVSIDDVKPNLKFLLFFDACYHLLMLYCTKAKLSSSCFCFSFRKSRLLRRRKGEKKNTCVSHDISAYFTNFSSSPAFILVVFWSNKQIFYNWLKLNSKWSKIVLKGPKLNDWLIRSKMV